MTGICESCDHLGIGLVYLQAALKQIGYQNDVEFSKIAKKSNSIETISLLIQKDKRSHWYFLSYTCNTIINSRAPLNHSQARRSPFANGE